MGHRNLEKQRRWAKIIEQRAVSGQTIVAFCRERQIHPSQFHWWRRRLKQLSEDGEREQAGLASPGFVELVSPAGGASGVSLQFEEGLSVVVTRGFDRTTLRSVLAVLGEARR